jgi:hypothetical protein
VVATVITTDALMTIMVAMNVTTIMTDADVIQGIQNPE